MRAATLLALIGVSRPICHLITSNDAILIEQNTKMLLPALHVYYFTGLINYLCLSV